MNETAKKLIEEEQTKKGYDDAKSGNGANPPGPDFFSLRNYTDEELVGKDAYAEGYRAGQIKNK